jgi:hypothetical protein
MEVVVPHRHSADEVKKRVQNAIAEIKRDFGHEISDETEEWNGDECRYSFRARGYKLSGTAQIRRSEVMLKLKLPLIAYPFKPKIRSVIQQHLGSILK